MHEDTDNPPGLAEPPTAPASNPAQKKPSGQDFRIARRERETARRAAQTRRNAAAEPRQKIEPVRAERAHLQALEVLTRRLCDVENDADLVLEDRVELLTKICQAMGKISANAECEREAEELAAIVHRERDANLEYRRKLQLDAKRHLCPECGAKTGKPQERLACAGVSQGVIVPI